MNRSHPLTEWLRIRGVQIHPSLYLHEDPLTGLSFYTASVLSKDTTVIRVPTSLCITSSSAFAQIQLLFRTLNSSSQPLVQDNLPKADWVLLYLVLTRLASSFLSTTSSSEHGFAQIKDLFVHITYVDHIPTSIETPLHFAPSELALLSNTPLVGSTERRLSETITDYGRARDLLFTHLLKDFQPMHLSEAPKSIQYRNSLGLGSGNAPGHHPFMLFVLAFFAPKLRVDQDPLMRESYDKGLELWRWAESAFTSRSFPPRLVGEQDDAAPVLIPGYDTFNHRRAAPVTWSSSGEAEEMVVMTLNYAMDEAEGQVWNNYGGKSNEEFLSSYGFTVDGTSEDTLALKLGVGGKGEGKTHYWRIPSTIVVPTEEEKEEGKFQASSCPSSSLLAELEERVLQGEERPVEETEKLELYGSVLETLEAMLLAKRKAFRASQEEVDATPQPTAQTDLPDGWYRSTSHQYIRPGVLTNIKQYRKGQLEVLNHAVNWTRTEMDRLADTLYPENDSDA